MAACCARLPPGPPSRSLSRRAGRIRHAPSCPAAGHRRRRRRCPPCLPSPHRRAPGRGHDLDPGDMVQRASAAGRSTVTALIGPDARRARVRAQPGRRQGAGRRQTRGGQRPRPRGLDRPPGRGFRLPGGWSSRAGRRPARDGRGRPDGHRSARLAGSRQRQALCPEHRARAWPRPIRHTPPTTPPMPQAYLREIAATDGWVRAELAKVPAAQRKVVSSHDAFGYFARAYGITSWRPKGSPRMPSRRPPTCRQADRPGPCRAHQGPVLRERVEPAPGRADRRVRPAPWSAAHCTRMRCRRRAVPPTLISACSSTTCRCCATPCWPVAGKADWRMAMMAGCSLAMGPGTV